MSFISVRNLIVDFKRVDEDGNEVSATRALDGVSLDIGKGSFVAIVGMNGSGKSTLAKTFNGLIEPTSGEVLVDGMSTADGERLWDIRRRIGMVFQNPDNQIVSSIVEDDVAFGPENLGVEPKEIRERVDAALKKVDMYDCRDKGAHMLSGGQKQRIAIAGAVAMKPECIVFDEPTAMLDPRGRDKVLEIIKELNSDGITVILITHYMEEAEKADRIVVMKEGRIFADTTPDKLFNDFKLVEDAGLELPVKTALKKMLGESDGALSWLAVSSSEKEGAEIAELSYETDNPETAEKPPEKAPGMEKVSHKKEYSGAGRASANKYECVLMPSSHKAIEVRDLRYVYNPGMPGETVALDEMSFDVDRRTICGIIGHTGSGKSTLLQHLNGLIKPASGEIMIDGSCITDGSAKMVDIRRKVGLVFQYPEYQLFEETVAKDVAFGPRNLGLKDKELEETVRKAIDIVGLDYDKIKDASPFELSGGMKRRAAIAGVIAMKPDILILDEPTAGLDPKAHGEILRMIRNIHDEMGVTIILVSHNMDDIAAMSDKVLVINEGRLMLEGTPKEVFSRKAELGKVGLNVPEIMNIMADIKRIYPSINENVLTIEEAVMELRKHKIAQI